MMSRSCKDKSCSSDAERKGLNECENHCSLFVSSYCSDIPVDSDTHNPTKAWTKYKNRCKVISLAPMSHNTPVTPDKVRFVCLSDTHSQIEKSRPHVVPDGDVLLHAGDFTNVGLQKEVEKFNQFLEKLPHKHKIVIAGNMDRIFEGSMPTYPVGYSDGATEQKEGSTVAWQLLSNCIYLQDSMVEIYGIKIYGSPWQPEFCDLAFNLPRGEKLLQKWNKIPKEIDILLTHGPPLGYGMRSDDYTLYINASHMNRDRPINPPIIFDFPLPQGYLKSL